MPTRRVNYHRLADRKFLDAIRWYARRSRVAATGFIDAVQRAVSDIGAAAESFPVEVRDVRWLKLKHYPYILRFLIVDASRCQIVAASHTSRRPLYWIRRLSRP
jgi:plasmid stabilization system protein ParE